MSLKNSTALSTQRHTGQTKYVKADGLSVSEAYRQMADRSISIFGQPVAQSTVNAFGASNWEPSPEYRWWMDRCRELYDQDGGSIVIYTRSPDRDWVSLPYGSSNSIGL